MSFVPGSHLDSRVPGTSTKNMNVQDFKTGGGRSGDRIADGAKLGNKTGRSLGFGSRESFASVGDFLWNVFEKRLRSLGLGTFAQSRSGDNLQF